MPTATKTIRDIALENPAAVRIFESFGIDYCCGGRKSLTEACAGAKAPVDEVLQSLEEAFAEDPPEDFFLWKDAALAELTNHIVDKYHVRTRKELSRLRTLLDKVVSRHSAEHPELFSIQGLFAEMSSDVLIHLMKEEQILFPRIVRLDEVVRNAEPQPSDFFFMIEHPIRHMLDEHDSSGKILKQMRELSGNFRPPADSCLSYQALYIGLDEFERDFHMHVHLENNILFPRALDLCKARLEGSDVRG